MSYGECGRMGDVIGVFDRRKRECIVSLVSVNQIICVVMNFLVVVS